MLWISCEVGIKNIFIGKADMMWGFYSWLLRPPNTHVNICTNLLKISPALISAAFNTAEHAYFLEIVAFHTFQDTIFSPGSLLFVPDVPSQTLPGPLSSAHHLTVSVLKGLF